jgi:hypothetical protein
MQSVINNDMQRARAGMIAYPMREARVQTFACQGVVPFGYCVVKGTTAKQCKVPAAAADVLYGIAQMTLAINQTANVGAAAYADKDAANVLKFGEIWVPYSGTAPVPGTAVFVDVLVAPGKVTSVATNNMVAPLKCVDVDTATQLCLVEITAQI